MLVTMHLAKPARSTGRLVLSSFLGFFVADWSGAASAARINLYSSSTRVHPHRPFVFVVVHEISPPNLVVDICCCDDDASDVVVAITVLATSDCRLPFPLRFSSQFPSPSLLAYTHILTVLLFFHALCRGVLCFATSIATFLSLESNEILFAKSVFRF